MHGIPRIKIEEAVVVESAAVPMGERQRLGIAITKPWSRGEQVYAVTSGDMIAIGVNPAGITPSIYESRATKRDLTDGDDPDYIGELYYQTILAWWGERATYNDLLGTMWKVHNKQLPSHGIAKAPLSVRYFFGIPRSASYRSRQVDVKENLITAVHSNNDPEMRVLFGKTSGNIGSYLEGSILDQTFLRNPGSAISSVRGLQLANEQGIPIYRIDQSNVDAALAAIQLDIETENDIANGVAAGMVAYAPQRELSHNGFTGAGYIIMDPASGGGPRLITGGQDGAEAPAGQSVYPLPELPARGLKQKIVGQSLRGTGASLAIKGGVVVGIAMPASRTAASLNPIGLLIGAIIIARAISSSISITTDEEYLTIRQVYRHYTTIVGQPLILGTQMFIDNPLTENTFGPGIYFEEPPNPDINCPVTDIQAEDIAKTYEIKSSIPVSSWVEVAITRAGYWDGVIEEQVNNSGGVETIFRLPFLYFGPYAVAIEYNDTCF